MKRLMLFSVGLALLVSLTAFAQDTTKPSDDQAKQDNTKAKTVTGCLQKGDQPDQFSITGEDGKSWDLRSSTVKLADHVGHQVTVTGSPTREAKAEEKKEGQVEKAAGKEELGETARHQLEDGQPELRQVTTSAADSSTGQHSDDAGLSCFVFSLAQLL